MAGRRGNREGSIYQRKDGRWAGAVTLAAGKRKAVYGATRREVQLELAKVLKAQHDGLPIPGDRQTTGQYLERWLDESARQVLRPRTFVRYQQLVRRHVLPPLGHIPLSKLTPQDLNGLYTAKLRDGLSPRSVQFIHAVIHKAFKQATIWGLTVRNVADLVQSPKPVRHEFQPLTPDESRALLAAAKDHSLEGFYILALTTGMRLGELRGLRWADVDLAGGHVQVRSSLYQLDGQWHFGEPKSERSRRGITLSSLALTALKRHRTEQAERRLELGAEWQNWNLVFCGPVGEPISEKGLRGGLHRLLASIGLPPIRLHDLRHSAATLLLSRGVHPRIVQDLLGHSTISLTLDVYSHMLPNLQKEAADQMDALLGG